VSFVTVDLDADVEAVHQRRRLGVLEGLLLHHVAPVAGAVADGDQQRLVLFAGADQSLLAPGMPIHRIAAVLQQVGAGFVRQPIDAVLHLGSVS
jgi:hypothetical protein